MTRSEIEAVYRAIYEARLRDDVEGTLAPLHPECEFRLNGRGTGVDMMASVMRGHAPIRGAISALIDGFKFNDWMEVAFLVDGERAAVHWRARVTHNASGGSEVLDGLDVCRFKDGKIVEFLQSFDSAMAMKIAQIPA